MESSGTIVGGSGGQQRLTAARCNTDNVGDGNGGGIGGGGGED